MPRLARTARIRHPEPAVFNFNPNAPIAEQVLASAQSSRDVVQDFCPLAESLEWELGQQYLRERGNKAFISDASPVPFVINNDGTLSRNAAEVFFANLVESEKTAPLEDEIFVLELGIGVGLFARYFLDNFRELCRKNKQGLLRPALLHRRRPFAAHAAWTCCGTASWATIRAVTACGWSMPWSRRSICSAMRCLHGTGASGKPLRAVFLNYLLDCLPAAVLETRGRSGPATVRADLRGPQCQPRATAPT